MIRQDQLIKIWFGDTQKMSEENLDYLRWAGGLNGFEVEGDIRSSDLVALYNLNIRDFLTMILSRHRVRRVQIVSEPRMVWPWAHNRALTRVFQDRVLLGRLPSNPFAVPFPQRYPADLGDLFKVEKKDRAVIVNAHKFSYTKGELYSLRRECASGISLIDLFGFGWEVSKTTILRKLLFELFNSVASLQRLSFRQPKAFSRFPNYFGISDNKLRTLADYKVAVVIENSEEFMSEKLFDAWFAGCLPIYVGPNLEQWGIPEDLYIQASPSSVQVERAVREGIARSNHQFREKLKKWLELPEVTTTWEYENATRRIYSRVKDEG